MRPLSLGFTSRRSLNAGRAFITALPRWPFAARPVMMRLRLSVLNQCEDVERSFLPLPWASALGRSGWTRSVDADRISLSPMRHSVSIIILVEPCGIHFPHCHLLLFASFLRPLSPLLRSQARSREWATELRTARDMNLDSFHDRYSFLPCHLLSFLRCAFSRSLRCALSWGVY